MRPQIRITIQSRVGSSRLPGKALLPLRNWPATLLCARRAASTGLDVRVALPDSSANDSLARLLEEAGCRVVRGSEQDVLSRYLLSFADLDDADIGVRLTSDNMFPDGEFVSELVAALQASGAPYLATTSPQDGLPYGLSAEAFRVGALRESARQCATDTEREHVTSRLWATMARPFRPKAAAGDRSHLRCTLDLMGDYLRLIRVFDAVPDPLAASWVELSDQLARLPEYPHARVPFKLRGDRIISTLALSMDGLRTEEPAICDAAVHAALCHGITFFDSGSREQVGEVLLGRTIGSLPHSQLVVATAGAIRKEDDGRFDRPVREQLAEHAMLMSARRLKLPGVDVAWAPGPRSCCQAVWSDLEKLQREGFCRDIGAFVGSVEQLIEVASDKAARFIKLAGRQAFEFRTDEKIAELIAKRPDVVVAADDQNIPDEIRRTIAAGRHPFIHSLAIHPKSLPGFYTLREELGIPPN